ncbi:hypothetical protein GCM10010924_32130 [Rhizobium wenxiniae]|nr:hypothetical protein GCM10010924_32130 [Rhizobium wenxiniae]
MDDEKILAFIEAIHRADFDAVGIFAADTVIGHDISHEALHINALIRTRLETVGPRGPDGGNATAGTTEAGYPAFSNVT